MELSTTESLEIKREFNSPVAKVFDAWTNPLYFAKWFGPQNYTVVDVQMDVVVGGHYSVTLKSPSGELIIHRGEYLACIPNELLVFTWVLDNQGCSGSQGLCGDTLVTLSFAETQVGALLNLLHERLPNQAAKEGHNFGWQGSLDSLSEFLMG